jgi:hypothetical protein
MKLKKHPKNEEKKQIEAPRLVKAADVAAREAAEQIPVVNKPAKPIVRTPRNAMEARDLFNALFGEAA